MKEITSLSFDDLSAALHSGRFSARKVLHAYQYHAAQSNKVSNFICEPVVEAEVSGLLSLTNDTHYAVSLCWANILQKL